VIELACGESESGSNEEAVKKMMNGTENGRSITWFKNPDPLMVSISRVNLFASNDNGECHSVSKLIYWIYILCGKRRLLSSHFYPCIYILRPVMAINFGRWNYATLPGPYFHLQWVNFCLTTCKKVPSQRTEYIYISMWYF
jgi:hypothetical protein